MERKIGCLLGAKRVRMGREKTSGASKIDRERCNCQIKRSFVKRACCHLGAVQPKSFQPIWIPMN